MTRIEVGGQGSLAVSIERSAAPAAVRVALARLESVHPGVTERLEEDPALGGALVATFAASRALARLLQTDLEALAVLSALDTRSPMPGGDGLDPAALGAWKSREYLRIAVRDLLGLDDLPATGAALAHLATDVLDAACRLAGADDLVVVGMGKLGGTELNYASDIDIMFVTGDGATPTSAEAAARRVMGTARRCFRVDANLRPEGRDGPLVRTVESYRAYWERWARPWEFQALLKARPVTGPPELARDFAAAAAAHLWDRSLSADDLRSLRAMKARAEADVAGRGVAGRELKRGAGGIRDIEFSVQLLQLVHGRHDPALRSPNTLRTLAELAEAGYVGPDDAGSLDRCYRLLRTVEHRVQLVDELAEHVVPEGPADRERLARVLGFRDRPEATALVAFDAELARCRSTVRSIHERLYFRPLLEAFAGGPGTLGPEATETRLAAFGFTDAARTRQAVEELTRGLTRSSRLMRQLLPLLFGWLADSPDPDRGLLGLRTLAAGARRELTRAFRESPEVARRLCCLLGTSRLLGELLGHNPDLIPTLADGPGLAPRAPGALAGEAAAALNWREPGARHRALKRLAERELVRIAVADVVEGATVEDVAGALTTLAEATVEAAAEAVGLTLPLAVVAMGRFGGAELSYASDLDVVFVYEGSSAADFTEAERVATALLGFVGGESRPTRIFTLDPGLRPEGRQGPLARSLDGFASYFERWAQVWERQAMLRARPVAGDPELGQRFLEAVAPFVWGEPLGADGVREIRRMKARIERERLPAGEDPQFHLKLGRGSLSDVEFCAQLLQLQHGVAATGTMAALTRLHAAGALDTDDLEVLTEAYRFCERTRNRLYLVQGAGGDALPQGPEDLARLARSLDTTPTELRERYRRVTRRARAVVERVFYGRR
ncbi:MAG: bifunctional [glutamine synthetase] adenylyltransferase/[glutamine synthetase]-adenylyl-L-tyrosine phosphorylase [Acidimicrobiales bacterium]